jgi:nucleotide-binding universal stress UspA family protein
MLEIKKILFPVDFSEAVDELVPFALTLAQKFAADLYVLTVTPDMSSFATFYAPHSNIQGFQDEVYKGAEKKIDALMHHLKDARKVETRIVKGSPAEQIIETAKKEGIDLIVMGTHSRKGLEKAIFGSVCDKVIKSAVCPVLSIPPKG